MSVFTRFRDAEKRNDSILDVQWRILDGGFLHMGKFNWTFCQRFALKGSALFGTEEAFMLRAQVALDQEPRFSLLTLELGNLFEARWVYLIFKIWPGRNFKFVFNFGWTLTLEARKNLKNQIVEKERRSLRDMRKNAAVVKPNEGGHINGSIARAR